MTDSMGRDQLDALFHDLEVTWRRIDYEPVIIAALELIADGERAAFDAGTSPGGESWAANAPSTIRRKVHGIVLFESGALERSLVTVGGPDNIHETSHRGLLYGTEVPYSLFNQEGTSRIPARKHVGMNAQLLDAIVEEVADFAVENLKG